MGLAAIDVDLVHFSKCKLIVSWNAMENVIRAVHVRNCASYISACVCPTFLCIWWGSTNFVVMVSIFVFQAYSLKSLHIIMTNQAISEVNRAVTKQLNGNQTQTKSMNVGQWNLLIARGHNLHFPIWQRGNCHNQHSQVRRSKLTGVLASPGRCQWFELCTYHVTRLD